MYHRARSLVVPLPPLLCPFKKEKEALLVFFGIYFYLAKNVIFYIGKLLSEKLPSAEIFYGCNVYFNIS